MNPPLPFLTVLLLACLGTIHAADTPPQPATTNKAATPSAKKEPPDFDSMDADAQVAYFVQNRKSAAADPFRPLYHFSPPGFGLHDVSGLCRWPGKYHLFYLYSPPGVQWGRGHAVSDDLVRGRFAIEKHGRMNYGAVMRGSLHAPTGFVDTDGRCIGMWNIMECMINDNFLGTKDEMVSLPRQLAMNRVTTADEGFNIRELNPLGIEPIDELKALRFNPVKVENVVIPANGQQPLAGVQGRAMELEAVIDPKAAREVGLRVLHSPNGEEQTTFSLSMHAWAWPWQSNKRELMIDVSQASLSPDVASRTPEIGPLYLRDGEPLHLRVFIDRSVIEVFANGRQCLTLRAYPTRPDSTGVSVFARGSEARLVSLTAWQMKSIWPELRDQEGR